jgi:hypothetical protein
MLDVNELKRRLDRLILSYHHYQAPIDNLKSGNADKTTQILATVTAEIAGKRSISLIATSSQSNETSAQQSYAISPKKGRLLPDYVNTIKKIAGRLEGEHLNFKPAQE